MVCIAVVTGQIVRGYQILWLYDLKKFHKPTLNMILGPVFDSENVNWIIFTSNEIYTIFFKKTL